MKELKDMTVKEYIASLTKEEKTELIRKGYYNYIVNVVRKCKQ